MNAYQLGKIEEAANAAWMLAGQAVTGSVMGVSIRVDDDGAKFEVVYDKDGHLTCKRYQ